MNRAYHVKVCIATPRSRPLIDVFKDLPTFNQDHHSFVVHITTSMGKKEKAEVGAEVGEGVKNIPEQIWPYLFGILCNSFPN